MLTLASFLGEQLRHLHLLPRPPYTSNFSNAETGVEFHQTNGYMEAAPDNSNMLAEWDIFIRTLNRKKKDASSRLTKWYAVYFHTNINAGLPDLDLHDHCGADQFILGCYFLLKLFATLLYWC